MPKPALPIPNQPALRPVPWRRALWFALLLVAGLLLQQLAALAPERTDAWYSRALHPRIAEAQLAVAGLLPFSLGELLLLLLLGAAVWHGGTALWACCRRRRRLANALGHGAVHAITATAALYLLFLLLWGLNHARLPFAEHVGLQRRPATVHDLRHTAERLAARAAARRPDDAGTAAFLQPHWQRAVADAYAVAGRRWPVLAGPAPVLRAPVLSPLLTLASVTGIYSPFTGEAHVNGEIPALLQPFVACHEVAHLRGFAREDEANFIAWWVGSRSADDGLAYACELAAFRHVFWQLRAADPAAAAAIAARVPQVMQDARAIDRFWSRQPAVQRVVTSVATFTNDVYLRSSGHGEGVRSYGRMVDLLVAALSE